jgi:hypothetical protein
MPGLRSMDFDVCLYVRRSINSGLSGSVLQGIPQEIGYRPRLGRGVLENCCDRSLRLLSHYLLRKTCHFQQIVEDVFAHRIECSFKRDYKLGVQRTCVHRDCCTQTDQLTASQTLPKDCKI